MGTKFPHPLLAARSQYRNPVRCQLLLPSGGAGRNIRPSRRSADPPSSHLGAAAEVGRVGLEPFALPKYRALGALHTLGPGAPDIPERLARCRFGHGVVVST